VKKLHQTAPNVQIVMFSAYGDKRLLSDAIQAGAKGYVMKGSPPEDLIRAIHTVAEGRPRIVVDLSEVSFMDSSGLGALIAGLKKSRQASGDLRITGVTQQVATVLQLTNLDKVLRAHPSVEAATDGW
jgi:anti-anti-sigma factor